MRKAALACTILIIAGCKKEEAAAPPAAPPAPSLAGSWNMVAYNPAGDSVLAYRLHAASDTAGWTLTFPGRTEPVAATIVSRGGDSVVTTSGPYESVLRRGVQVSTHSIFHVSGDSLHGVTHASYSGVRTADSMMTLTQRGSRMP